MLYGGPWLAERAAAIDTAMGGGRGALHPVTREVLSGAEKITATDVFRAGERLTGLRRQTD
jgi:allophanate hydrolase